MFSLGFSEQTVFFCFQGLHQPYTTQARRRPSYPFSGASSPGLLYFRSGGSSAALPGSTQTPAGLSLEDVGKSTREKQKSIEHLYASPKEPISEMTVRYIQDTKCVLQVIFVNFGRF